MVVGSKTISVISLIMIASVYGLQALVFILRRKWDMVGWMVFYILAIPIFSFMLPIYSFWRMDDFSWGATRVVLGESGKKLIVHNDYENELWDKESNHSIGSWVPPGNFHKESYAESRTASLYGHETYYKPHNQSPAPSQFGYSLRFLRLDTNQDMQVLRTADLNMVTKREIRKQLEEHFGMCLTPQKGTINASIDHAECSAVEDQHDMTRHDTTRRKLECAARSAGREETIGRGNNAVDGRTAEGAAAVTGPGEGTADETTGSMSLTATASSLGDDSRGLRARCTCVTNPQNPNATRQVASNAAADPTTPNAKSTEPREPAGALRKPENVLHKSVGSSARGKTQGPTKKTPRACRLRGSNKIES
ncbi:chitin synthase-domain-containing protein [Melanogaster broomeanus]|nr:chitin synthase-domain-containing protein [Melanogaster broomeanus]